MRARAIRHFVGALTFVATSTTFASQLLFDNLTVTNQFSVSVGTGVQQAQGFITGASTFLERVSLGLRNYGGVSGPFTVQLFSGSASNAPGVALATLAGPSEPGTGVAVYTPTNTVILDAGKTYWVVGKANTPSGQFYDWGLANYPPSVGDGTAATYLTGTPVPGWGGCVCDPHSLALRVEVRQPVISALVPGSNLQFSVSDLTPGRTTVVQVSSNLANWVAIWTNVPATSSFVFTNASPVVKTHNEFYRVVQP
jgi:hypothetical protein